LQEWGAIGDDVGEWIGVSIPQKDQDFAMVRTDSRKANQRRRFQRQRLENRKRLLELKATIPVKKEES
jgi:hypothetical protein